MLAPLLFILWTITSPSTSLPQGAPSKVCGSMLPFHGGLQPQDDPAPFTVVPRRSRGAVVVTLTSPFGSPFQGFMIQAKTPSGLILGEWEEVGHLAHSLECNNPRDAATHTSPDPKSLLELKWQPPNGYEGSVIFNATIAQEYSTFWTGITSDPVEISKRSVDDPIFIPPGQLPFDTTTPYYSPNSPAKASTEFDPFYSGCAETKLCFGAPDGCIESKSCKAVTAVTVIGGDEYQFEMKATDNAVWVGVGLSDDEKMGDDSVIECVRNGNSVNSYLSWTSGSPNYGAERSRNSLGIRLMNGSVIDGTLYCKVHRDVRTNINGRTFDLMNNKYNLLVASGTQLKPNGVGFHNLIFLASGTPQALADVSSVAAASRLFIRLHGCFMIAAWIATASIGTLLARYYRKTWVGSTLWGKDVWFSWHRLLMILTWGLTIAAFVLIFVELGAWSAENNPHAILGTITTVLCFVQPIGAFFRPHPGTSKRPYFNWMHWLTGNVAHIFAIVTLFFAVRLAKAELPEFVDWILVAYVAAHVVIHLMLSIMGCISEKSSDSRISSIPMRDMTPSRRSSSFMDRKLDASYGGFRKVMLGLYIIIVIGLAAALIVITALAPIEETWKNLTS